MTQTPSEPPINAADVKRLANLARLTLSEADVAACVTDMQRILHHMRTLDGLNLDDVATFVHSAAPHGGLRADVVLPGLPIEKALANAPERLGDGFGVPKIIE